MICPQSIVSLGVFTEKLQSGNGHYGSLISNVYAILENTTLFSRFIMKDTTRE